MPQIDPAALPRFAVEIAPPDLGPWIEGNTGVAGFSTAAAAAAGPHVMVLALMHGNEVAGSVVLERMLRAGLAPLSGG